MAKFIKINPDDNVAVCLEAGQKGETATIDSLQILLSDDIPVGHKIALQSIKKEQIFSNTAHQSVMQFRIFKPGTTFIRTT